MTPAFKGFKKGTKVEDAWFKDWGVGVVVKRTKRLLHVRFPGEAARRWSDSDGVTRWDSAHVRRFLRPA